ncbi:hypothetical protein IGI04_043118 [Brassica rapa subsp. trilocularis]|uniref:Uncharacterized protein n=1 Tax=Brassica rapa subsp. trilocularis TaxID=1813537 RepID=A0ABQ7KHP7_BRACM|nr:hypothetical protein IGI04_043118 [Brassica rapa subsp. trilocularis]
MGCLFSTHRTSVGVHQRTQDVRGCLSAHTGRPWLSVCVRVCPSAHTGRPWLSISTHISTLVLGLSMLTLPVDCSSDFGPCRLSVQYTQDVRGCPPAHTGRLWLSVAVRQHTQDVRRCPSAHTGRLWLSVSTHRPSVRRLCVLYVRKKKDVRGCPWSTQSDVGPLDSARCPSRDLSGDFGPTVAVCHVHTDVRGRSVRTPRKSVCCPSHTQDVRGCPVCVRVCRSAKQARPVAVNNVNISRHCWSLTQHTYPFRGCWGYCPCVSVSTHRTSVALRVCPCVSVSTHRMSVAVPQYTYQHVGPWTQHVDPSRGLFGTHRTSVAVRVCPCLSVSAHRTSAAVHQYTYQHVGPRTQHADPSRGLFGTSVVVRVCPSAHTGHLWLSISTHISTLVLGLSILSLPVDCSVDFGPRGLSVQYTQDVRGCPPAHTGRLCVSVCVRQHTQDVHGCPSVYISARWSFDSTHTGRPWLSVAVRVCLSAHT